MLFTIKATEKVLSSLLAKSGPQTEDPIPQVSSGKYITLNSDGNIAFEIKDNGS